MSSVSGDKTHPGPTDNSAMTLTCSAAEAQTQSVTGDSRYVSATSSQLLTPTQSADGGNAQLAVPASDVSVKLLVSSSVDVDQPTKLFKRRWLILFLFASYSTSNAYQWIHLNIIFDKVVLYYNESLPSSTYMKEVSVDWLSMVYMLAYIPLILPATWLLDRHGLRVVAISATLLNALGAWMKCAAVSPDLFALLMTAQTICAVAQVFILGIPARLAAVWFGPNEVSTATAIGVFGNQVSRSPTVQYNMQ